MVNKKARSTIDVERTGGVDILFLGKNYTQRRIKK